MKKVVFYLSNSFKVLEQCLGYSIPSRGLSFGPKQILVSSLRFRAFLSWGSFPIISLITSLLLINKKGGSKKIGVKNRKEIDI